ncbi:MAG: serpin family protein [Balneolaceae bacterium]|nr:serpin family protein [Balneolaceae bacterium]
MKKLFLFTPAIILFLIVASCNTPVNNQEDSRELSAAEKTIVTNNRSFGFELFKQTIAQEQETENVFISPLSLSMALGMTLNGAKAETYQQIQQTLALSDLELQEINEGYRSLAKLLTTIDPKVKMQIANSVWNQKGFEVEDDFTKRLQTYFNAKSEGLDFNDPAAKDVINKWVENETNGMIDKIIDANIPPEMVMYLINAIYFKGTWTHQFDENQTKERDFHLDNGTTSTVDMMSQTRSFSYLSTEQVQMIDLPYGDSLYSMTLMMPKNTTDSIDEFIANDFTYQNFSSWLEAMNAGRIQLSLPKFQMNYKIKLNDVLKSMGMVIPFEEHQANFEGINPGGKLFISEVAQKAIIKVNESGTEAAAVTSVGVGVTSMPPSINFNQPFVFMIREQSSGTVLFMGKVGNPSWDD